IDALRTAAALGKIFAFRELAAVSAVGEDALLDSLDEASGAQLIRAQAGVSSAGDDMFAFTHDKIREVLYEELNPIRRRRLHQRIGEGLERLSAAGGSRPAMQVLAHHFVESGNLEKGLRYSLRAAEESAALFAHEEALGYYEH